MELSKDQAMAALHMMIDEGIVTEEQITQALIKNPPPDVCMTVDSFHTFMCTENHTPSEFEEYRCTYYQEEELEGTWQREMHKEWSNKAAELVLRHNLDGFNDLKEALQMFAEALKMIQRSKNKILVLELLNKHREREAFASVQGQGGNLADGKKAPLPYDRTGGGLVHCD
uniref:Uncharacterized protein n=2 Tax=viral metagenome TaxID=1070528 RepID=A0A6M3JCK5_9ZZZZ